MCIFYDAKTGNFIKDVRLIKIQIQKTYYRAGSGNKNRLPLELIFYCAFENQYKAFDFEKYLKSGSGRAFMKRRLT